jgi:peptidoglycan/xylan/chitin deacetylase (PgdA/CDA1 family)
VTVREGLERLESGARGRWVAMSFDDGYADNVHAALPALREHGARATFYLAAGLIEERRAPWWDDLAHVLESTRRPRLEWQLDGHRFDQPLGSRAEKARALAALVPALRVPPAEQRARLAALAARLEVREPARCLLAAWPEAARLAEAGMEVGAHTLTHPFLTLLEAAEQESEIGGSVALVAERLGVRPSGLAYPGGDYDARSVAAARAAGLGYAVTTRAGEVTRDVNRFELLRRGLSEGACLGPGGRFSARLAIAELDGAFDGLRAQRAGPAEVAA